MVLLVGVLTRAPKVLTKIAIYSQTPWWLRLLSILRWWFCCCWSIVQFTSHCLWEFCVCLCFVMHYFVPTLVLKSSWRGIESCLLFYYCLTNVFAGQRSAVGYVSGYRCVSDCRSRGREFDPGLVPYFHGIWSWNYFYGHSPPFRWFIQEGLLSVTSETMCTNYWLTACSSLPRKKCG